MFIATLDGEDANVIVVVNSTVDCVPSPAGPPVLISFPDGGGGGISVGSTSVVEISFSPLLLLTVVL